MPLKDKNLRREYHRKYMKEVWYPKNSEKHMAMVHANRDGKLEKIADYKLEKGCVDCGYSFHSEALDFDHLSDKKFNISLAPGLGKSWDEILLEISKCEVVCSNCHRVRTRSRLKQKNSLNNL